jgi:hypothetical protein
MGRDRARPYEALRPIEETCGKRRAGLSAGPLWNHTCGNEHPPSDAYLLKKSDRMPQTGETGSTGPTGSTGETGSTGPTGSTGKPTHRPVVASPRITVPNHRRLQSFPEVIIVKRYETD